MKLFVPALGVLSLLGSAAVAQVVYSPPRIQYGQYNEIIYGGTNPVFTSNDYVYLPEKLQANYVARRQNAPTRPYPAPFQLYGHGGKFFSPYFIPSVSIEYPSNATQVFSDLFPYEEVGHLGYTIDDAHNEAYARVSRVQVNSPEAAIPARPMAEYKPDPKAKAIPLLNWAKAEHDRNPALYRALLQEAAKWDPVATAEMQKQMGH